MKTTQQVLHSLITALLLLVTATPTARSDSRSTGETKVIPQDGTAGAHFGACLSRSAGRVLVGAAGDLHNGAHSGSAYVYDVATGQQLAKLVPQDGANDDLFGSSVALYGSLALVGAHQDDDNGIDSGSAYVFDVTTGQLLHKLTNSDGVPFDHFGASVALYGRLGLIGAWGRDDYGGRSGAAYFFDLTTGQELLKITAADAAAQDYFGASVALDEDLALVGADREDNSGYNQGAVYVFDPATGQQLRKLKGQSAGQGARFGCCISLDGDRALIGAYLASHDAFHSGAAYLFDAVTGQQLRRIRPLVGDFWEQFGFSVSLQGDLALVGAIGNDAYGFEAGAVYVMDVTTGQELRRIIPEDAQQWEEFGSAVAFVGERAWVGAHLDNSVNGYGSGAAYMYENVSQGPGIGYCFGDAGSGTPCPCNNDNNGSQPGAGCRNGTFPSGARLTGDGIASVSNDSLVLTTRWAERTNAGLFFQANGRVNGGDGIHFGDGLRCAGFGLIRLEVLFTNTQGMASTSVGIGAAGGVLPGDTKRYQFWYRTTNNPPCGLGVNDFNTSNGYEVTWLP